MAGPQGPQGPQGSVGMVGPKGQTSLGLAAPVGPAGDVGAVGPKGPVGPRGTVNSIDCWNYYRDFTFANSNVTTISNSDTNKLSEMATYLASNPSLSIGITADQTNGLRATAVHDALINVGVPATKIQIGSFADSNHPTPHDGRVVVFVKSSN